MSRNRFDDNTFILINQWACGMGAWMSVACFADIGYSGINNMW
jgi:hypothetical protein